MTTRQERIAVCLGEGRARLHAIEVDILEGLQARPEHTWCTGCNRLLDEIYKKATAPAELPRSGWYGRGTR